MLYRYFLNILRKISWRNLLKIFNEKRYGADHNGRLFFLTIVVNYDIVKKQIHKGARNTFVDFNREFNKV